MGKKTVPVTTKINAVRHAIEMLQAGSTADDAWDSSAVKFNVNRSTVYRWYTLIKGRPVECWAELLKPRYKGGIATAELTQAAWEYFLNCYQKTDPPSTIVAHQKTLAKAAAEGWSVPSVRTLQRRMKQTGVSVRPINDYNSIKL